MVVSEEPLDTPLTTQETTGVATELATTDSVQFVPEGGEEGADSEQTEAPATNGESGALIAGTDTEVDLDLAASFEVQEGEDEASSQASGNDEPGTEQPSTEEPSADAAASEETAVDDAEEDGAARAPQAPTTTSVDSTDAISALELSDQQSSQAAAAALGVPVKAPVSAGQLQLELKNAIKRVTDGEAQQETPFRLQFHGSTVRRTTQPCSSAFHRSGREDHIRVV